MKTQCKALPEEDLAKQSKDNQGWGKKVREILYSKEEH